MDHFELHSEYKPTGDQPQAIERLVRGFKEGNQFETLLGVTGSGKTFTMANVIAQLNKPTLILAHNKTLGCTVSLRNSSLRTQWNILSPIMTTISRRLMSRLQTPILPKTPPSMTRLTNSVSLPQPQCQRGKTQWSFPPFPVSTDQVPLRNSLT